MKFLLVYFLVVQIPTVIYAYRRHGTSSRNSASFLLRKVCVEVAGLKEEIADLKEEKADFKEEIADFKEEIADLKEENADFKEEIADLKEEIADLKEENQAMMQPG